jgi:hypothetical protein
VSKHFGPNTPFALVFNFRVNWTERSAVVTVYGCVLCTTNKVQFKLSLWLTNEVLPHEDIWKYVMYRPRFLGLRTSWKWVLSFAPRPLQTSWKSQLYSLGRPLVNVEKTTFFTLPVFKLRPIYAPGRSRSLYRMSYRGSRRQHIQWLTTFSTHATAPVRHVRIHAECQSVCASVCMHGTVRNLLIGYSWSVASVSLTTICTSIHMLLESDREIARSDGTPTCIGSIALRKITGF